MPPAPQARRTWGTRYDSLVDTQTSTQCSAATEALFPPCDTTLMSLNIGTKAEHDAPYISGSGDVEKERRSSLMQPPQQDASATSLNNPDQNGLSNLPPQTRMPHDASVFVASLPSSLSEHELHSRLTNHLAQFATIRHVKLIKDNRSAVCAFVQVESANEATALISACNFSMFMGRQIRCERARAFRTLLISWKSSRETMSGENPSSSSSPLRLRRCKNTRYIQVTSDSEALIDDPSVLHNFAPPRPDDMLSGTGAFFPDGLRKDNIEGLRALLEAFGPLEFMQPFDPAVHTLARPSEIDITGEPSTILPVNAVTSSSPGTFSGKTSGEVDMWAAKWEHRNDAVAAIQALQHVPALCIEWLHTYGRPYSGMEERWVGHRVAAAAGPRGLLMRREGRKSPVTFNDHDFPPLGTNNNQREERSVSRERPGSGKQKSGGGAWSGGGRSSGFTGSNAPSPTNGLHRLDTTGVPSASAEAASPHPGETSDTTSGIPVTPDLISGVGSSPITPLFPTTPVFPATTGTGTTGYSTSTQGSTSNKVPEGGRISGDSQIQIQRHDLDGSIHSNTVEIHMDAARSTRSPSIEKGGHSLPLKPALVPAIVEPPPPSYSLYHQRISNGIGPRSRYQRRDDGGGGGTEYDMNGGQKLALDLKELFVGGLDPQTWNEDRVRNSFEQYGGIKEVRFVKPSYNAAPHRRAFAFIRFEDVEGPQRAIAGQHLRVYDGHTIKVQLRDSQPFRRPQWGYRPRGQRFNQVHSGSHSSRGGSEFSAGNAGDGFGGGGGGDGGSQEGGSVHPLTIKPTMRCLSAPADGNGSPRKDIIAELTAREAERLAKIQLDSHGKSSTGDGGSPAASASTGSVPMEVGNSSAEISFSASESPEITLITSPVVPISFVSSQRVTQSEPDVTAAGSPRSNGDARSSYPPSPPESTPPTTTAMFYGQTAQAWPYGMPPYGPYGYYPPPVPVSNQSAPDGSNPYWMMSVYPRPYVPWFDPPPGVELAPPPVRPSGFLQRDTGGILIPVYSPERLGQYVSPNVGIPEQTQPGVIQPTAPPAWQNIPSHPQMYPVPIAMPPSMVMPPPPPPPQQQQQQGPSSAHTTQVQQSQQQQGHPGPNISGGWIHAQTGPSAMYSPPHQQGGHSGAPAYTHASASTSISSYPTNLYYPIQPAQPPSHPSQSRQVNYVQADHGTHHSGHHTTPVKSGNRRGDPLHRMSGGGRYHYKRNHGKSDTSNNVHGNGETQWPKPTSALPVQLTMAASHWS